LDELLACGTSNFEFYLGWGNYFKVFDICVKLPNSIYVTIHNKAIFEIATAPTGEINREALREIYPTRQQGCFIRKPVTIDYLVELGQNWIDEEVKGRVNQHNKTSSIIIQLYNRTGMTSRNVPYAMLELPEAP
jgi:hypothetical protein